jgi:hypothetical protein
MLAAMETSVKARAQNKQLKAKRGRDSASAGERVALLARLTCEYPCASDVAALAAASFLEGNPGDRGSGSSRSSVEIQTAIENATDSLGDLEFRKVSVVDALAQVSLFTFECVKSLGYAVLHLCFGMLE